MTSYEVAMSQTQPETREERSARIIQLALTEPSWKLVVRKVDWGNWTFGVWTGSAGKGMSYNRKFGIELGPLMLVWHRQRWV